MERQGESVLADVNAILVPGGFGDRGFEGKVRAVRYARERRIPYFGICYGLQAAVVEYARNVLGLADANSTETDRNAADPVIGLITEWRTASGELERRAEQSDRGGTLRPGAQQHRPQPGPPAQ